MLLEAIAFAGQKDHGAPSDSGVNDKNSRETMDRFPSIEAHYTVSSESTSAWNLKSGNAIPETCDRARAEVLGAFPLANNGRLTVVTAPVSQKERVQESVPPKPRPVHVLGVFHLANNGRLSVVTTEATLVKRLKDMISQVTLEGQFPLLVHQIVTHVHQEDPSLIRWEDEGKTFYVNVHHAELSNVLKLYFNHGKFTSFQRQ